MTTGIQIGEIAKCTVVFAPETGSVALADVTAKFRKADRTEVALAGITENAGWVWS